MFVLKQWVDALASPLMLGLLLAVAALLMKIRRRPTSGNVLLLAAGGVIYLGSSSWSADLLISPLERRYAPLSQEAVVQSNAAYVVVLGSGYSPREGIPITAALDPDGLTRIVEGVRLARLIGGARLVMSGGAHAGGMPPSHGYAALARSLGIHDDRLVILDEPLDTSGEAKAVVALVGDEPFILVTSAYHMPRAVLRMRDAGASPIPAPTGQVTREATSRTWRYWFPSAGGLGKSERAVHEYLGLVARHLGVD
jgi:uncharacterized SAM-binding protein YcdF (DUF218 family)